MAETKEQIKLKLVNVHKSFGNKKVLSGVDLEIKKGESLVIIGSIQCTSWSTHTPPVRICPSDARTWFASTY